MIVIFLRGGLGNQMFQYALGRNLARKYGAELVFDTTFLADRFPRGGVTFYNYDLDVFGIVPRRTALSKIAGAFPVPGVWLGIDLLAIKARDMLGIRKIYKERSTAFDPEVLRAGGNALLWGFWQSEKYFKEVGDELRRAFRFVTPLAGEAVRIAEEMQRTNSVSLHVRRGDYVTAKNVVKLMGGTDIDYYRRAIAHVAGRVKGPHFFVISNDPAWCRENLGTSFPTTYLDNATAGPKASFHLELMSRCKHNVIANSTFSWWGAWLNANPKKIVVAPKKWFADPAVPGEDIVPGDWTAV